MKFFATILSVLFFNFSFSQMKVEDVKNDKDVIKFINTHLPENKAGFFFNIDSLSKLDTAIKQLYGAVRTSNWLMFDINNDKKQDLFFCGKNNLMALVVGFISDSNNGYKLTPISSGTGCDKYFVIAKLDDDKLILSRLLNNLSGPILKDIKNSIIEDTIFYNNGGLTEFSQNKSFKKIDSLKIIRSMDLVQGQRNLLIKKDGNIYLEVVRLEKGEWIKGRYEIPQTVALGKTIIALAENLPYYKYLNRYSCDVNYGYNFYTAIYFSGGETVKIDDHIGVAPFGLRNIYNYAFEVYDCVEIEKLLIDY